VVLFVGLFITIQTQNSFSNSFDATWHRTHHSADTDGLPSEFLWPARKHTGQESRYRRASDAVVLWVRSGFGAFPALSAWSS